MRKVATAPRRVVAQALAVGCLLVSVGAASPASAYVRYRSKSDCVYAWRTRSIVVEGFPRGLADMTLDQVTTAMTQAAGVWTKRDPALASCTDFDLAVKMRPLSDPPPAARYDGKNLMVARADAWCPHTTAGAANCEHPYDPSALAITSIFAREYGQIIDADIEVNAANFIWADLTLAGKGPGQQDLQNALTHEVGHLIGLDHTCNQDPSKPGPRDHHGVAVPVCSTASSDVMATTMFASAGEGDISKRTLEPDDRQAVCDTYPLDGVDTLQCPPPDTGACAVAPGGGRDAAGTGSVGMRAALLAAAVTLMLAAVGVIRRRPPSRAGSRRRR